MTDRRLIELAAMSIALQSAFRNVAEVIDLHADKRRKLMAKPTTKRAKVKAARKQRQKGKRT